MKVQGLFLLLSKSNAHLHPDLTLDLAPKGT
jgi:hypothetical protein